MWPLQLLLEWCFSLLLWQLCCCSDAVLTKGLSQHCCNSESFTWALSQCCCNKRVFAMGAARYHTSAVVSTLLQWSSCNSVTQRTCACYLQT